MNDFSLRAGQGDVMADDYRVTFFFGPDQTADRPDAVLCVFNVKKRSWKGGVQIGVEVLQDQLAQLSDQGQVDELVEMIRAKVDPESFSGYEQRTRELFAQQICRTKLDLAIAGGITQENHTIPADALVDDLNREALDRGGAIRHAILMELDV
jgi:hypothetical protein